jgi:hypothetical protein
MRPVALEDLPSLDIRTLKREGYLVPGHTKMRGWQAEDFFGAVKVMAREKGVDVIGLLAFDGMATSVDFEVTKTGFGYRRWWLCPECGRRCAVLYVFERRIECRHCTGLSNISANLGRAERLQYALQQLGERIGRDWTTGTIVKPKGMHWTTWMRLNEKYEEAQQAVFDSLGHHPACLPSSFAQYTGS